MTCCFIGHSNIRGSNYEAVRALLEAAVERHIVEYGVTDFLVGNHGDFDRLSARVVKEAKAAHPGIHLYLMLPYMPDQGHQLPDMEGLDNSIYPEGMEDVPYKVAIPRLNRIMVQDSTHAIAYVQWTWGGAATTLEYARRRERQGLMHIENLADA